MAMGEVLQVKLNGEAFLPGSGSVAVTLWRRKPNDKMVVVYDPDQRMVVFAHPDYEACEAVPFENVSSIRFAVGDMFRRSSDE